MKRVTRILQQNGKYDPSIERAQKQQLEARIREQKAELEGNKFLINKLTSNLAVTRQKVSSLEIDNAQLKSDLSDANLEISWLNDDIQRLKEEKLRLRRQKERADRRNESTHRQVRKLTSELEITTFLLAGSIGIPFLSGYLRKKRWKLKGKRPRNKFLWRIASMQRASIIGGRRCELCQVTGVKIIGHHIIHHADGGYDTVENCQLRCEQCETDWHRTKKKPWWRSVPWLKLIFSRRTAA